MQFSKNGMTAEQGRAKWPKNEEKTRYYGAKSKYLTFFQKSVDILFFLCYNMQVRKN